MLDPKVVTGKDAQTATAGLIANNLGFGSLFDRVINIKISYSKFIKDASGNKQQIGVPQTLLIRSDYEYAGSGRNPVGAGQLHDTIVGVVDGKGAPRIKKVAIKPDIRMAYKGIGNAGIDITITVGNLFMFVPDYETAKELNSSGLNEIGIEFNDMEILFGYMPDFPNLENRPQVGPNSLMQNFMALEYHRVSYIRAKILYWYRSKTPPDAEYTFYCAFCSVESPVVASLEKLLVAPEYYNQTMLQFRLTRYQSYLAAHKFSFAGMLEWYIQYHYPRIVGTVVESDIDKTVHTFTQTAALAKGVTVFIESLYVMECREPHLKDVFIGLESNVVRMLAKIKYELWNTLDYRFDMEGNVHIYDTRDSKRVRTFKDEGLEAEMAQWNSVRRKRLVALGQRDFRPQSASGDTPFVLPAVYDVQYGPITMITCPFVGALAPGQKIVFNARYSVARSQTYAISDNVPNGEVVYTVQYYELDFGTTGEYNTMRLYCTR